MHLVVFRHSEENTNRVKFLTFTGPLLSSFSLNHCQKKLTLLQNYITIKSILTTDFLVYIFCFLFMSGVNFRSAIICE